VFALFTESPRDGAGGKENYRRVPFEGIDGRPDLIFVDARLQRAVAVSRNTLAVIARGEARRPITPRCRASSPPPVDLASGSWSATSTASRC